MGLIYDVINKTDKSSKLLSTDNLTLSKGLLIVLLEGVWIEEYNRRSVTSQNNHVWEWIVSLYPYIMANS